MSKLFSKLGHCAYVLLSLKDGKFYMGYSPTPGLKSTRS